MKKFAGMVPLTFVLADEGKNGLVGPAPSCSIAVGTVRRVLDAVCGAPPGDPSVRPEREPIAAQTTTTIATRVHHARWDPASTFAKATVDTLAGLSSVESVSRRTANQAETRIRAAPIADAAT